MTTGVTGIEMFDGKDDLRVLPEVIPHFVLVRLVNLVPEPLRFIHVALFPRVEADPSCHILTNLCPVEVPPSGPVIVPVAYEANRGCECTVIVNFPADDGDLLQCRDEVTLLPSPASKLDSWEPWESLSAKLPEQTIQLRKACPGSEVVGLLSRYLHASLVPVQSRIMNGGPDITWRSVDPVSIVRFTPPSSVAVRIALGAACGSRPPLQVFFDSWLPDLTDKTQHAFEAGRLTEHLELLLGMEWKVADFLDTLCALKILLQHLGVTSPFAITEELLQSKKDMGDLSGDEKETVKKTLRDVRWMVAGQMR